jgi:hypothetical protein
MHHKIIFLTLFLSCKSLFSGELSLENLPYKKNIKEKILDGQVFSESKVKNIEPGAHLPKNTREQSLKFSIAGLHPKSCSYALKTLSLYEDYSRFLSFVKESRYDEKKKEINFLLSNVLLPYDMRLVFNLPRITSPGAYPFTFNVGILKNLQGTINVIDQKGRCLFYSTADWRGPYTGFNPTLFELFSQVLSKLSMEILFRISSSLSH